MKKVLIIADDLTGANANCSLMKKIGLRAASFLATRAEDLPKDIDVIAATTDSRAMTSKQAYREIQNKLALFNPDDIHFYSKRIDSTLRGNLGSELRAYQDYFTDRKLGVCVPSYPDSKRIVIDGKMYVNGNLLMNTDAGKDPKMPVVSNYVLENFKKDYKGKTKLVTIEEVEKGEDHLKKLFLQYEDQYDLVIFDSITNDHIKTIASSLLESKIDYIAVDPGPFTKELTALIYKKSSIHTKAMAVIGSVTQISIDQMKVLKRGFKHYQVDVDPEKLMSMDSIQEEINRCLDLAKNHLKDVDLLILTTTPDHISKRLDLMKISENTGISVDDLSLIISRGLANIAKRILQSDSSISGVFSSGGDITVALAEELLSLGIEIKEELMPLVAYGRLIGGKKPGLKIVSKGGMVGGPDAMVVCVDKLLNLEE
ncbi:MAG: four-carbon acid sugar kinase family protein [Tissierellia bacterium]|nr:four-carbon acid sugar kinase family protein [Tissierellia bacterium]